MGLFNLLREGASFTLGFSVAGLPKMGTCANLLDPSPAGFTAASSVCSCVFLVLVVLQGSVQLSGGTEPHGCGPWALVCLEPPLPLLPQLRRGGRGEAALL